MAIFNQLKEYWFNNGCEEKFQELLNGDYEHKSEAEVKCLTYMSEMFTKFSEEKNLHLNFDTIEVIINWGIIMHEQIKNKFDENNI